MAQRSAVGLATVVVCCRRKPALHRNIVGRNYFYHNFVVMIEVKQDQYASEGFFEGLKCCCYQFVVISRLEYIFLAQFYYRRYISGELQDSSSMEIEKSCEELRILDFFWIYPLSNCVDLGWIDFDFIFRDDKVDVLRFLDL